jgi:transposase
MIKGKSRLFYKIRNRIKNAHHKISKFLCESCNVILLPDYKSSEMVQTGKRKIQDKTMGKMQLL